MKLANAAIGLAAVGAGFLVARIVKARRAGETRYVGGAAHEPLEPNRLIGYPMSNVSAHEVAETLHDAPHRRM